MLVANISCKEYVDNKKPFEGSNLFGEWFDDQFYVVFSYGYHFPIYVYNKLDNKWYKNTNKYSITTSKHQSQAMPSCECTDLTLSQIRDLLNLHSWA